MLALLAKPRKFGHILGDALLLLRGCHDGTGGHEFVRALLRCSYLLLLLLEQCAGDQHQAEEQEQHHLGHRQPKDDTAPVAPLALQKMCWLRAPHVC